MKDTIQYILIDHHCVTHPVLWETYVSCKFGKLCFLYRTSVWGSNFNDIITKSITTRSIIIFINGISNTFWLTATINSR